MGKDEILKDHPAFATPPTGEYGEPQELKSGEFWKPEKAGDMCVGVLVGSKEGQIDGKPVTNYELKDGEDLILLPSNDLLLDKMGQVPVGSLVQVRFLEDIKSKTGRTYKEYDVKFREAKGEK